MVRFAAALIGLPSNCFDSSTALLKASRKAFVGARVEQFRVDRDVGGLCPAGRVQLEADVGELLVEPVDEFVGRLSDGDAHRQQCRRSENKGGGAARPATAKRVICKLHDRVTSATSLKVH
jgi:hypothetical protein